MENPNVLTIPKNKGILISGLVLCAIAILLLILILTDTVDNEYNFIIINFIVLSVLFGSIFIFVYWIGIKRFELYHDRLILVFRKPKKPRTVMWIHVKSYDNSGKMKLINGKDISLLFLDKDQYLIVKRYLSQYRESSTEYPRGSKLQKKVVKKIKKATMPKDTIQIFSIIPKFNFVMSIFISLIAIAFFVASIFSLIKEIKVSWIVGSIFVFFLSGLFLFFAIDLTKKRKFNLDSIGIQKMKKNKIQFESTWNELFLISSHIHSSKYGSSIYITFKKKDGRGNKKTGNLDSTSFKIEDLKKAFKALKKFAVYYDIPLDNELKW